MLNYSNLNDVEFEHLCSDIMTKKLGKKLRRFAPGKDGGVDLTDDVSTHNIVVQVKHYIKTDANGLIRSLKKEVSKVDKLKPKKYYVCCSKELTNDNIKDIYNLFLNYMKTDENVISFNEIDDFLTDPQNNDILRKHYKLWLSSTGILQDIFTNDIFIDSEVLLSDIEKQVKFFVQTQVYDEALKCLGKNRVLFITGDPGVGKTITSKMLVLYFSAQGYSVRYTTNGTDLSQLKKSLTQSGDKKEIILLDDCFGQAYFNMKETQGSELLNLIKYVHLSSNKILVLNSRVTIYQEAKVRTPDLISSFENKEYRVSIIDINQMSNYEKAKIYYNHLYFNQVNSDFWDSLREEKMYRKIITHKNYNPRIIEFVSNPHRFAESRYEKYIDFVIESLDNPINIWNDEYEKKLNKADRILISTLYSLTETNENYDYVKLIFNDRINGIPDIDSTIDQFESSLLRLQESFIKIVGVGFNRQLSMINPSINDYLNAKITRQSLEYKNIIDTCISVKQFKRLLTDDEFNCKIKDKINDKSILNCIFESEKIKDAYIAYQIMTKRIFNQAYRKNIYHYLDDFNYVNTYEKTATSKLGLFKLVFDTEIYNYYLTDYFSDWECLKKILKNFDTVDLIEAIAICYNYFEPYYDKFMQMIIDSLDDYGCVEANDYDSNLSDFVDNNKIYGEYGNEVDIWQATDEFKNCIEEIIIDEIADAIELLPSIFDKNKLSSHINIDINGAESVIESYVDTMRQDDDDDDSYHIPNDSNGYLEIDEIFDR